jgi:hypothetical protein
MSMASMEYQLSAFRKQLHIRENESEKRWLFKHAKKSNPLTSLEEEIDALRRKLEQMVVDGREMTSESVIELSIVLDRKINEYMNNGKKSR